MRTDVLGVGFDDISADEAVERACGVVLRDEKAYVVTPNPEIVWMCRRNEKLSRAVERSFMTLPDGVGIMLGARIMGTPLKERIPGIDFAGALLMKLAGLGKSVYLLGAKPGVAGAAGRKLLETYPGIKIAGASDGYFSDDGPVIEEINSAAPDLLFVCLGAPKQELWMAKNIEELNVRLCVGLGGSLDIFAGMVKRAPKFFRKMGLEWFYRLICEPRRIKRMIKLPLFVFALIWRRCRLRGTSCND